MGFQFVKYIVCIIFFGINYCFYGGDCFKGIGGIYLFNVFQVMGQGYC